MQRLRQPQPGSAKQTNRFDGQSRELGQWQKEETREEFYASRSNGRSKRAGSMAATAHHVNGNPKPRCNTSQGHALRRNTAPTHLPSRS